MILNNPALADAQDERLENHTFEEGEVYSIDLIVSTGDGRPRFVDDKETTVFKRNYGTYHLGMKSCRQLITQVDSRFSGMLFSLRNLEGGAAAANDSKVKLAVRELTRMNMLAGFPVTWEKDGEKVAQAKGTFITMPNGNDRLNGFPAQEVESDKKASLPEDIRALLSTSLKPKKKKKKAGK
jgi:methionine aminopeptidase